MRLRACIAANIAVLSFAAVISTGLPNAKRERSYRDAARESSNKASRLIAALALRPGAEQRQRDKERVEEIAAQDSAATS